MEADNSNLTQILHAVANASGMKISGLSSDSRLFGQYGPGDVREVLSSLLVGSGYNFIMVGGVGASTPQELLLTAQTGNPTAPGSTRPQPAVTGPAWATNSSDPSEDDDVDATTRVERKLQRMQEQQQVDDHHLNDPQP